MSDLPLRAKLKVAEKMLEDYEFYSKEGMEEVPVHQKYRFVCDDSDDPMIEHEARIAALQAMHDSSPIKKIAFDTRKIDQARSRNPRKNFQAFQRSEPFIFDKQKNQVKCFNKLAETLSELRAVLGDSPTWHESHSRQLLDQIERVTKVGSDVYPPHLDYIEQLLYARYRLTPEQINDKNSEQLQSILLSKDADLNNHYEFIKKSQENEGSVKTGDVDVKDFVKSIFGGEKPKGVKERTITITIRDYE